MQIIYQPLQKLHTFLINKCTKFTGQYSVKTNYAWAFENNIERTKGSE